jgi:hypothetical protein
MANRTGGGGILFGLNKETDFKIAGLGAAHGLQALRPELTVAEIEMKRLCAKAAGAAQGKNLVARRPRKCRVFLRLFADRDRWFLRAWQQGAVLYTR